MKANFKKSKPNKKNHNGGEKVTGSIKFCKSQLDNGLRNIRIDRGVTDYRDMLIDLVAQRMRYTLVRPLFINNDNIENIEAIIRDKIEDAYVSSFICCSLNYYAEINAHILTMDRQACYLAGEKHKSLKQAQKDCEKCAKVYVAKAVDRCSTLDDINTINRIKSCEKAINIFAEYIFTLQIDTIPKMIDMSVFTRLNERNVPISEFYTYDGHQGKYVANNINTLYKNIDLLIATELFFSVCKQ